MIVRASSIDKSEESETGEVKWTVLPFLTSGAQLTPKSVRVQARRAGSTR